jgi:hypothetical protein
MSAPRISHDEFQQILSRRGYGIASSLGKGIASSVGKRPNDNQDSGTGADPHLESAAGDESLRAKAVSLNYSGKPTVRLKFFRRRLADYSRAISEKALVDGLVYASLIRDDSEKEIRLIDEGQEKVGTEAEERTEIAIEYPEVDFDNLWIKKTKFGNSG